MAFEVVPHIPPVPDDNIVRLTDFIERRYKPRECRHDHLLVDDTNRKVECKDCGREIEPFEAVLMWADRSSEYQHRYDAMKRDHTNLADYVPHLRDVRELESMWRGAMLPCCPHCHKGVTPRGLLSGGVVSKSFAEALAKHEAEQAVAKSEKDPAP